MMNWGAAVSQPTWPAMKSKVSCVSVTSPVGGGPPEFMIAARKRPSVLPLFASIWSETEIAPALWPQLGGEREKDGEARGGAKKGHEIMGPT